jgi:uncharacterized integral membrane protein (TIGR00698 family)
VSVSAVPRSLSLPAWGPGIALAAGIGGVALALATVEEALLGHQLIEALVLALLLGVAARALIPASGVALLNAGTSLAAKHVLEVSVAFLGASVSFPQMLRAGGALLVLVIGGVLAGIGVSFLIGRALGLTTKLAVLVAVGNSICGNSAIAAVAPVIRAEKKDVASAVGLTAVIGVLLILALPLLIVPLALSTYQYGVLAGMAVYAVPQVVAAAFPISQLSGEVATLVKLTRVLMLGPVVVLMGLLFRGGEARRGVSAYLPWFVIAFLGLAVLRSVGAIPDLVAGGARDLSRLMMVLAMAGLGFGVELAAVRKVGPRVGLAVVASLAFMAIFTLAMVRLLGVDG